MTVKIIKGNLLDAFDRGEVNVIGHVVNCQGVMGSGIAKSIKDRYPDVYLHYKKFVEETVVKPFSHKIMGDIQSVSIPSETNLDDKYVYNLFAQDYYGKDKRHVNYGAISQCLCAMSRGLSGERHMVVPDYFVIGFPYMMASDRGGADWSTILEMVEFYFKDYDVRIYKLN